MRGRPRPPSASSTTPASRARMGEVHEGTADDGLDGAGAGARHHHHGRLDDLLLARPPHQHHRHARARRLHDRGRAQPARARRRGRGVLRRRRRRAAVGDGVAPGRQVPRAAHRLHQQVRSRRRRSRSLRRSRSASASRPHPVVIQIPNGARGRVLGRRRSDRACASSSGSTTRMGAAFSDARDPRRARRRGEAARADDDRGDRRGRRRGHGRCTSRAADDLRASCCARRSGARPSPVARCRCWWARRSRTRACSRCSTPSSTTCRRRSTSRRCAGMDPDGDADRARGQRRRAVLGAGVQDHERPVRRVS